MAGRHNFTIPLQLLNLRHRQDPIFNLNSVTSAVKGFVGRVVIPYATNLAGQR